MRTSTTLSMNCTCSTSMTAPPPTPPPAPPLPSLPQRSRRAEELVVNVRLDDLGPVASTAQATNKARTSSADEPDRASCRQDREGKGDDTATVACVTCPRQRIMLVASLCTKLWLPPSFTSHVPHKGQDMTGYRAPAPTTRGTRQPPRSVVVVVVVVGWL